jgi:hypothetical protein
MPEGRMGHPFLYFYFLTKATVAPLSVILVLWVPAAVNQLIARSRLVDLRLPVGGTVRSSSSAVVGLFALTASVGVCTWIAVYGGLNSNTAAAALLALLFGVPGAWFSLRMSGRWRWDSEGLTFVSWLGARTIAWTDVAKVETSAFERRVVISKNGRKLSWALSDVVGPEWIDRAITTARPDVSLAARRTD